MLLGSGRTLVTCFNSPCTVSTLRPERGKRFQPGLSNDVGGKLIFEKRQTITQKQFALLEPLNLQPVSRAHMEQCLDRGVEIPMLLTQTLEFRPQQSPILLA